MLCCCSENDTGNVVEKNNTHTLVVSHKTSGFYSGENGAEKVECQVVPYESVSEAKKRDEEAAAKKADEEAAAKKADEEAAAKKADEEAAAKKADEEAAAKKADEEAAAKKADEEAAAKKAEAVEAARLPGLAIVFEVRGEVRSLFFTQKPLGIDFGSAMTVTNVKGEQAVALGVQAGWKVKEIGGKQLVDSVSFDDVKKWIGEGIPDGLPILFSSNGTGPSWSKVIYFTRRPLGLDLEDGKMPMTVSNAQGQALTLGVCEGWQITEMGGRKLADSKTYKEALRVFKTKVDALPL